MSEELNFDVLEEEILTDLGNVIEVAERTSERWCMTSIGLTSLTLTGGLMNFCRESSPV